jgi:anti-anti-sigma factor
MNITEHHQGRFSIYRITGRVDTLNASELDQRLTTGLANGSQHVILDCGNLEYITSTGMGVLFKIAQYLQRDNGTMVVCALAEYLREVFEIAGEIIGLGSYLPQVNTLDDALQVA